MNTDGIKNDSDVHVSIAEARIVARFQDSFDILTRFEKWASISWAFTDSGLET